MDLTFYSAVDQLLAKPTKISTVIEGDSTTTTDDVAEPRTGVTARGNPHYANWEDPREEGMTCGIKQFGHHFGNVTGSVIDVPQITAGRDVHMGRRPKQSKRQAK